MSDTLHTIEVEVNGRKYTQAVEARMTLADFLRERLRLTGTHLGCEHGVCGACTILVEGDAMRSCTMYAVQAHGLKLTTVEGLNAGAGLNALQSAFKRHHALQCGFCTSGMLMCATALLNECPAPTHAQARDAISGNLCRCTGYIPIVEAIVDAAGGKGHSQ
ncbi:MAG: (2Fe-2S)-binding protein [Burkholderiaceae bacterium]|nr:(2Fe-2S)-binding protein [Burkholderiaceae bacterium]